MPWLLLKQIEFLNLKKLYVFILVCMCVLPAYMNVCVCVRVHDTCHCDPEKSEEHPDALETVTDGCELPCGCWELNLGFLQQQQCSLL